MKTTMQTTGKADFYDFTTSGDTRLFSVNEEMPVNDAILTAACLAEAIKHLAEAANNDEDLAAKVPYVIAFLASTVQALCNSTEVGMHD